MQKRLLTSLYVVPILYAIFHPIASQGIAWENGHFDTKERNLIVTDERQRSWNVILRAYHDNVDLRSGWSNIRDANCLKEGDRITFEIVTGGNKPIWKMHRSRPLIGASISRVSSVSLASLDLVFSVCTKYKFRTLDRKGASEPSWFKMLITARAFARIITNLVLEHDLESQVASHARRSADVGSVYGSSEITWDTEALPDVVMGMLQIFYCNMYAFLDSGYTLSYMTPYVAVTFAFKLEIIPEPFSISTLVGDSIMARRVYRNCVVSVGHRDTVEDLVDLDFSAIAFLGHIVSTEGIKVDPQKIEAVRKWVRPTTPIDIRSFLGLAGYYRRFIECFSSIAASLTKLTQKKERILDEAHTSWYVVHLCSTKMYHDLKAIYYWNNIKRDVANFVSKCMNCQQVKVEHLKSSSTSQETTLPMWKWEMINMNFIMGFLKSQNQYDSICVIVDQLTKSAHFLPVRMNYLGDDYGKLYFREIVHLYGSSVSIISDRDGQDETLEDILRAYVIDFKGWVRAVGIIWIMPQRSEMLGNSFIPIGDNVDETYSTQGIHTQSRGLIPDVSRVPAVAASLSKGEVTNAKFFQSIHVIFQLVATKAEQGASGVSSAEAIKAMNVEVVNFVAYRLKDIAYQWYKECDQVCSKIGVLHEGQDEKVHFWTISRFDLLKLHGGFYHEGGGRCFKYSQQGHMLKNYLVGKGAFGVSKALITSYFTSTPKGATSASESASGTGTDPFTISTPVDDSVIVKRVYKGCAISVGSRETLVDLFELDMVDFDVILRMDLLYSSYAYLDCWTRMVIFRLPSESGIELESGSLAPMVVNEFPEVFLEDFLGVSQDREIEFVRWIMLISSELSLDLERATIYAKFSKCEFFLNAITFLGHSISSKGIMVDPQKVAVAKRWPRTMTLTDI
ncbi:hypothetical protein FXO38_10525 [Capsicum annuum]|nr:hypothetical protein FXO38_10525 [Capsicum annuum]KAF3666631.1 hypothetical protein FXO37_10435 [Capsicum annuum]